MSSIAVSEAFLTDGTDVHQNNANPQFSCTYLVIELYVIVVIVWADISHKKPKGRKKESTLNVLFTEAGVVYILLFPCMDYLSRVRSLLQSKETT